MQVPPTVDATFHDAVDVTQKVILRCIVVPLKGLLDEGQANEGRVVLLAILPQDLVRLFLLRRSVVMQGGRDEQPPLPHDVGVLL